MSRSRDIFDDLGQLRIDPKDIPAPKSDGQPRPKTRQRRQFVIFPRVWLHQLQSTKNVTAYRLAALLLFEHWRNGKQPVRVTNVLAAEFGVSRTRKKSAIEELERLHLVVVERGGQAAPLVTPRLSTA